MATITLTLNGANNGTGTYNPVPVSFSANPTTVALNIITGQVTKFVGSFPQMSSVWSSISGGSSFVATGPLTTFTQNMIGTSAPKGTVNLKGDVGGRRFLGETLYTTMTNGANVFNMLAR